VKKYGEVAHVSYGIHYLQCKWTFYVCMILVMALILVYTNELDMRIGSVMFWWQYFDCFFY